MTETASHAVERVQVQTESPVEICYKTSVSFFQPPRICLPNSIDAHNALQIEKAVKALLAYYAKTENGKPQKSAPVNNDEDDIDPSDGKYFWLNITTKKMPQSGRVKPYKIPVKHSFISPTAQICLFAKDPQKDIKIMLEEKGIEIDKVIGVAKLKTNYHPYEAKRQLRDSYDLFLTDDRIVALLPPLLGKHFFLKKKQPIPVNLTAPNLVKEIESARSATYMILGKGLNHSIKVGTTGQTTQQVVDNIYHSLDTIVDKIPNKWGNILRIDLKFSTSIALPLFTSLPTAEIEEPEKSHVVVDSKKAKKIADAVVGKKSDGKKKSSSSTAATT
ncbi:hypothetical protein HK100_010145, partial [Physocladia obscura]